jgi:hypothetical protein
VNRFKSWLVLPVQTVDATPSGLKLLSKVFMKPGKRLGVPAQPVDATSIESVNSIVLLFDGIRFAGVAQSPSTLKDNRIVFWWGLDLPSI